MTDSTTNNIAYYDALAADYELFFSDLENNMKQEGRWLADFLHTRGSSRILDASCGSGRQTVPLRELGFDVVAADPSAAMLRQAEHIAGNHHVDSSFIQADFSGLPSHTHGKFDAVIALGNGLCNLEHLPEIETALSAMRDCCRAGGICLVGIKDFDRIEHENERFHGHKVIDQDGIRRILFEIWDLQPPTLLSTAYLLTQSQVTGESSVVSAQTREYMLRAAQLRSLALDAGFARVNRMEHPSEAVFLLESFG